MPKHPAIKPFQSNWSRRGMIGVLGGASAGLVIWASLAGQALAQSSRRYQNAGAVYRALATQDGEDFRAGDATIRLVFADGAPGLNKDQLRRWVGQGAEAIQAYFGTFPAKQYGLLVVAQPGRRIGSATSWGHNGAVVRINVGTEVTQTQFDNDWVMTHEMMHSALPFLPYRALWVQEGAATYLEPIARALAGHGPSDAVWKQALDGMPKGLASPSEGGMDGTTRWGRLYWGGATFWLNAEMAIYRATDGAKSLRGALSAIAPHFGGNGTFSQPEAVMDVGDGHLGQAILRPLYDSYSGEHVDPQLRQRFADLGVAMGPDEELRYDDRAALAQLRRNITSV